MTKEQCLKLLEGLDFRIHEPMGSGADPWYVYIAKRTVGHGDTELAALRHACDRLQMFGRSRIMKGVW